MAKESDNPDTHDFTKKLVLTVATISSFLSPFAVSSTNVALPTIAREFHMSAILMTWAPMAYILAGATFLLPFGKIADIYGRKRVYVCGVALFTLASLLSASARSSSMLILSMMFLGIGGSITFGTAMALATSVFPISQRGRVLGIIIGSVYVGNSAGPCVGGFLTEHLGWRSLFLINGPIGLAIFAVVLWEVDGLAVLLLGAGKGYIRQVVAQEFFAAGVRAGASCYWNYHRWFRGSCLAVWRPALRGAGSNGGEQNTNWFRERGPRVGRAWGALHGGLHRQWPLASPRANPLSDFRGGRTACRVCSGGWGGGTFFLGGLRDHFGLRQVVHRLRPLRRAQPWRSTLATKPLWLGFLGGTSAFLKGCSVWRRQTTFTTVPPTKPYRRPNNLQRGQ